MKKMSPTILFFGNERLATGVSTDLPILSNLVKAGYKIRAVITSIAGSDASRSQPNDQVNQFALSNKIDLIEVNRLLPLKDRLAEYKAELAVLAAFGKLVPSQIIELFPRGIINVHPSLLPQYRGPTPIESALLAGDQKSGVSLMQLSPKMDEGPIYSQASLDISKDEAKQSLATRMAELGSDLLINNLSGILNGQIKPSPQDGQSATYSHLITKADGEVNWHLPATQIERTLRAYAGWPRSHTRLGQTDVVITSAEVVNLSGRPGQAVNLNRQLVVYCQNQALQINQLIPTSKKEMSAEAFLAGYSL